MIKTGFGFLRLPRLDPDDEKSVDITLLCSLVDRFIEKGGSYFDTAYTYLGGASEDALKKTLVERYPRDQFRIADKLPGYAARNPEDNLHFFEESLKRCGVDYFDVYLLHGLNAENYEIAKQLGQFSLLQSLKEAGKVKKTGFSYHDTAELLDQILTDHPEIDYVQLQINYLDWDSPSIQSRKCYETAIKHNKTVLVMEPVKGGALANLPVEAEQLLKRIHPEDSPARWAIRFASDLESVEVVLSGMNSMEQIKDNMTEIYSLTEKDLFWNELHILFTEILRSSVPVAVIASMIAPWGCQSLNISHFTTNISDTPENYGRHGQSIRPSVRRKFRLPVASNAVNVNFTARKNYLL